MSAVIPPAIPEAPPDQLDAAVDYVLALREEIIAARFVSGFTPKEWARISEIIGPLPGVLVILHDSETGLPDPAVETAALIERAAKPDRPSTPNVDQRGLSFGDAQSLATKRGFLLFVEGAKYVLDRDGERIARDTLQEIIAILRAPIVAPPEPPPPVRRVEELPEATIRATVGCGPDAVYWDAAGRSFVFASRTGKSRRKTSRTLVRRPSGAASTASCRSRGRITRTSARSTCKASSLARTSGSCSRGSCSTATPLASGPRSARCCGGLSGSRSRPMPTLRADWRINSGC